MRTRHVFPAVAAAFILMVPAGPLSARQHESTDSLPTRKVTRLSPVTVTATRSATSVFRVPRPTSVLDRRTFREGAANTITDAFRNIPGLDVTGVGTSQVRPIIRGQRGQRILLLQDGIRLNNSRRQQDFGELPALIDIADVERVEIVRGPASVLYGSDAIGGVINIITRVPRDRGVHGSAGYRFSTYDTQHRAVADLHGRFGRLAFRTSATYRNSDAYDAPSGSFGQITLARDTTVFGTGAEDESGSLYVSYDVTPTQRAFARVERYVADTTGFGWVDPAAYDPSLPTINIRYPSQQFTKVAAGYHAAALHTPIADRVDVTGWWQKNTRDLNLDIFVPFGGATPPGAGVVVQNVNFTNIRTAGFRVEAQKLVDRYLITWGVDYFRDDARGTDSNTTTVVGFGPPSPMTDTEPKVPNATFRSVGVFAQGDMQLTPWARLVVGARYQDVNASPRPGTVPGPVPSGSDRTLVGMANGIVEVTDRVSLISSVGRAFRSPNLVERFFSGPTPEGGSFQERSPDLRAETSFNVDVGVRYRDDIFLLEAFAFRNAIHDGIRIAPTGDSLMGLPVFRNVNVSRLRYLGFEFSGDARVHEILTLGGTWTRLDSKDQLDPDNPVGDTFSSRITGRARLAPDNGRFWVEYRIRHNAARRDVALTGNPLGNFLPAFTVHEARAGATLFRTGHQVHRIGVRVINLTNALYAEFGNASFFRPEPGRGVTFSWDVEF